jgi:hypothetical protein
VTLVRENGFLAAGIKAFLCASALVFAALPANAQNRAEACGDYACEAAEQAGPNERNRSAPLHRRPPRA